jgi:hypothetical protein
MNRRAIALGAFAGLALGGCRGLTSASTVLDPEASEPERVDPERRKRPPSV